MKGLCVNTLTGHSSNIFDLTLLPNGLIASGSADSTIKIWDISKTYPFYTLSGHTSQVRALTLINNAYMASCSYDSTIKLWSLSSYSIVKSWNASTAKCLSLAFDSTLNVLASGEDTPYLVRVWESSIWTSISANSGIFKALIFLYRVK